jgi:hypothetical protein
MTTGERSDTETVTLRSERGGWKRVIARWYLAGRLLNLAHPFGKETPWDFTARLFVMVKWASAIVLRGESFSQTRENRRGWAADLQSRHAQAPGKAC